MKYGETLQQRSIPLWETYNIDYNDIKHLIKVHTTKGQAEAITIPGKDNEAKALQKFEDELYVELREQHQRIDLFVQSKSGEITRRLVHLDKQIAQLEKRTPYSSSKQIPVRRLEKFAKVEEETLKAGGEIQSLSRFVGAQRLAFQKLLKKYKKWTGSAELGKRFQREVLGRPSSFSRRDFGPLLAQWSEVLAAVRAPFAAGVHWHAGSAAQNSSSGSKGDEVLTSYTSDDYKRIASSTKDSSATLLHAECATGSSIDVDTALAILPLGLAAGKALYWVHPDNLVEVQVLLLRYTRLWMPTTSGNSSQRPSPTRSMSGRSWVGGGGGGGMSENDVGVIICDDLERFAKRRSSATISDSENVPGMSAEKAVTSIRYTSKGNAVVVVGTSPGLGHSSAKGTIPDVRKARFKRRVLRDLFDMNIEPSLARPRSGSSRQGSFSEANHLQDVDSVRKWLGDHREVQPLVQIQFNRSRFVGLGNNGSGGVWATLDQNVCMRRCSSETLNVEGDKLAMIEAGAETFPHAVLEVRYEGEGVPKLVAALDESHLTERVRGFSLETHAVATLCKPHGMPSPFWLPALDHDIRKIPTVNNHHRRGSNSQAGSLNVSTRQTSASGDGPVSSIFSAHLAESSATSTPEISESPPMNALKRKRITYQRAEHPLRGQVGEPPIAHHQRYWNEFDDGEEGSDNEAYTIFVDPNAASIFPGSAALNKAIERMTINIKFSTKKIRSWLGSSSAKSDELQPLIDDDFLYAHYSAEDETDDFGDDSLSPTSCTPSRRYMPATAPVIEVDKRDCTLSRCCVTFFILAFMLLFLASVAVAARRAKDAAVVGLGVILSVILSLIFTVLAVGTMVLRNETLGWVYRTTVMLLFVLDCLGCTVLVMALGSA